MTSAGRAWRRITREPLRAALGVAGVAAVGALLFDMLLLSRGLLVSFRDLLDSVGYDVRVTATEALPTMGPPVADASAAAARIRALPQVDEVVPLRVGRGAVSFDGSTEVPVTLLGTGARTRGYWTITRGAGLPEPPGAGRSEQPGLKNAGPDAPGTARSDPSRPVPVMIAESLAEMLRIEPGAIVRLRGATADGSSILPAVDAEVVGAGLAAFDAPGEHSVQTTLEGYDAAYGRPGEDEVDMFLIASRQGAGPDAAVAAIHAALPELHAFSTEQFLSRFDRSDFSYFRQISFVLSTITLFFAFLLVATLLTVSVNQRLGEVAALRALGFTRGRVVIDLLWESALLVGLGGLLSLPLGAALAAWLDAILKNLPGLPERMHFFVFEPRIAALHAGLLCLTAILAALYPVWLAARLPIAATLRKEVVS